MLAIAWASETASGPHIAVWQALQLVGEPLNENMDSSGQAMNVWTDFASKPEHETVVGQVHRYSNMDRRGDDSQFAVAWESDGVNMREVARIRMSCPDVGLVVPNRGPFIYEFRLDTLPWTLHPECSCQAGPGRPCPNGVEASAASRGRWQLRSPIFSHFVSLENEWSELINDFAVLGRLGYDINATVAAAGTIHTGATAAAPTDASVACPGSWDEVSGSHDVTFEMLDKVNARVNNVFGKWCLVRRGGCAETAKVKVCELSGAVGTIIVDHGYQVNDQEIVIRYRKELMEIALRPVLFVNKTEGEELFNLVAQPEENLFIAVGPSVGGPPPESYTPGSGIIVHDMGAEVRGSASTAASRSYPDLFSTSAWVEASSSRDLLFVCLSWISEVRIYNISRPLDEMPFVGTINTRCTRSGLHDYRVLDHRGADGRYRTLLVDPWDSGNRLWYWDTEDPSDPRLVLELHANWEAEEDGLGQVRPGGPEGRYHFVTWHCADLYCGKRHGDSTYVLDNKNLTQVAVKVPLPMLSKGGFARDVACGIDGELCLVTLTWDGVVAIDAGADGSANPLTVVAKQQETVPFDDAYIPRGSLWLRMYSGAQKALASRRWPRKFYVEHADFSLRPLRMGDAIRALQLREVYMAEVVGYNRSVKLPGSVNEEVDVDAWSKEHPKTTEVEENEDLSVVEAMTRAFFDEDGAPLPLPVALTGIVLVALVLISTLTWLLVMARRANRKLEAAAAAPPRRVDEVSPSSSPAIDHPTAFVVVGRPVEHDGSAVAQATPGQVAPRMQPRRSSSSNSVKKKYTPKGGTE